MNDTSSKNLRRLVHVLVPAHVHLQDLAGPVQVFDEANAFGGRYDLRFCGTGREVRSTQGLWLGRLDPLSDPAPLDWILVPGLDSSRLNRLAPEAVKWLRAAGASGTRVASVCSGAFLLARAGLLDGRACTTHWKVIDELRRIAPRARVVDNRLFVRDDPIITSAGVTSGIDMALAMVEEDLGPRAVGRIAREMVVYLRRSGECPQQSVYLEYRTHLHPGIHRVQDHLVSRISEGPTIDELARVAGMSSRNLTRIFRRATGVTLKTFTNRLRLEVAENLLRNPNFDLESVASRCGFTDPRQLRRLWVQRHGISPSTWRKKVEGRSG